MNMTKKNEPRKNTRPMIKDVDRNGKEFERPDNRKTTADFIADACRVWGESYDYSPTVYLGGKQPVLIRCPKHDYTFRVTMAQNHVMKAQGTFQPTGCPICQYEKKYGKDYGPEWRDYLKLSANSNRVGLKRKPKKTAEQIAAEQRMKEERRRQREVESQQRQEAYRQRLAMQKAETQRRREAEQQERQRRREQQEQQRISDLQARFRREAPLMQGDGYIYKGVEQITSTTSLVDVHCSNPSHGWHPMRVDLILQGCKCRECAGRHQTVEQRRDKFLQDFHRKHGYNHYKVKADRYVNNDTPIPVHCLVHHYDYETSPDNLLRGGGGCPFCTASEGEAVVLGWLDRHHVAHQWHYQIPNHDSTLPLQYIEADFLVTLNNSRQSVVIEYHGEQHYKDVGHFYRDRVRNFDVQQHRDRYLRQYCADHHLRLLEIPYWEFDHIDAILTSVLIDGNEVPTFEPPADMPYPDTAKAQTDA